MPKEHKLIKGFVFRFVKKRIAGSTLSSVLNEARDNSGKGLHTTVTFLNDEVDDSAKARYNANTYVQLAKQSSRLNLNTDLSIRLSQLGMSINHGTLDACLSDVVNALKSTGTRVWFEAENGADVDELLEVYRKYRNEYKNIGVEIPVMYNLEVSTIKKMLKPNDMVKLTYYAHQNEAQAFEGAEKKQDGRKGRNGRANKEKTSTYILEHYVSKIGKLLQADVNVAVLEHDEKIITKIAGFSKEYKKSLIFELPLGYNERKINKLMKMKINLSIYTPYGKDWTSYVVNRLTSGHGRISRLAERVLEGSGAEVTGVEDEED